MLNRGSVVKTLEDWELQIMQFDARQRPMAKRTVEWLPRARFEAYEIVRRHWLKQACG